MQRIVECVANFSEGRRTEVLGEIVAAISSTKSVAVLGWESDVDHNRSVVSFAGEPAAVVEAAFAGIQVAAALIDMNCHSGQHPRIGAADVLPFVPLYNVSMADCVRLAHALGARVGKELRIPVFLYGEAALRDRYRRLADIRRGGYERLRECNELSDERRPDFGPRVMGNAGACAIGARDILIAFNVTLSTDDVAVARRIARAVRESSGGLPHLMALGFSVKGSAQVSMNLTNYRITSIHRALEAVRQEAHRLGVAVAGTELIGLAPKAALAATEASYVQIDNFSLDRVLEIQLARRFATSPE
ncbi:MAG: glutamate formimidoyltransferase [Chloroflexota bacterium]|nr:glutamate formimidoyltransferase [Chloroflexota bacterium]